LADDACAFGGSRRSRWIYNIAAVSPDPAMLPADRAWVRGYWEALRPHASGTGGYVNFLAEEDDARVRATYGDKYDRLAAIKAVWDPDNVLHHNANIKPSTAVPDPRAADAETPAQLP
jgi:hypothetical protein